MSCSMPGCVTNLTEMNSARTHTPKAALYALLAFIFPARQSSSCVPSSPQRLSMADEEAGPLVANAPLHTPVCFRRILVERQARSEHE